MSLACYFLLGNHFVLMVTTKLILVRPVESVSWVLPGYCTLCCILHRAVYMCDGRITLVKDCECSNEKLKQNPSAVLDSYACVIKLVIYFDL